MDNIEGKKFEWKDGGLRVLPDVPEVVSRLMGGEEHLFYEETHRKVEKQRDKLLEELLGVIDCLVNSVNICRSPIYDVLEEITGVSRENMVEEMYDET